MNSGNQGLLHYTSVIAIVLVAVPTAQLSSMVLLNGDITSYVYAKYSNDQAQSFVNECGQDGVTGINCGNNGPLMQGDSLASSPVITQFGGGQQQEPPEPPEPPANTATLIVVKNVGCEAGLECPPNLPEPEEFTISVIPANGPGISGEGSAEGTRFTIPPGEYIFNETPPNPDPAGLNFAGATLEGDCTSELNGPIEAGEERFCRVTNVYLPE